MSLMKIPASLLEKLHCQCGQYLSKAPVNIQGGKSVCSNCVDMQDPTSAGVLHQNFQYEALASLFAFPCRYNSQGCPKYIQFNKLENHEIECLYRIYECPFNLHSPGKCNWKDTTSQFCQHYETQHPELYLQTKTPTFEVNFIDDNELYRLIKIDNILLLLQTKCMLASQKVCFSMVCLKQEDSAKLINYSIKLSSGDSNNGRIMKLEDANPLPITNMKMSSICLYVNIPTLKDYFNQPDLLVSEWDINITEEFKLKNKADQELEEEELYNTRNEDIKCVNCNFYMVPPIYRCNKGHQTCIDCKGYYNECKTCQNVLVTFTPADDLENISKLEQHYCRWIKCRKMLSYDKLREHEQNCPFRKYICPECNIWSGTLQQLMEHFRLVHPEISLFVTPSVSFNSRTHKISYTIAHNEIFKINLETSGLFSQIKINIWFLGSPNFVNCWQYDIEKNSEKVQINFPKQVVNNYSCNLIIDKNEEIKIEPAIPPTVSFSFSQNVAPHRDYVFGTLQPTVGKVSSAPQNTSSCSNTQTTTAKSIFGITTSTTQSCSVGSSTGGFGNAPFGGSGSAAISTFFNPSTQTSVRSRPKSSVATSKLGTTVEKDSLQNPTINVANKLEWYTLNISKIEN